MSSWVLLLHSAKLSEAEGESSAAGFTWKQEVTDGQGEMRRVRQVDGKKIQRRGDRNMGRMGTGRYI